MPRQSLTFTSTPEQRINELFDRTGLKDIEIAKRLGVSKQSVSSWRTGVRSPKKTVLLKIADTFHIDVAWLLGYDDSTDTKPPLDLSSEEERMVHAYRGATEAAREIAFEVLINHQSAAKKERA